MEAAEYDRMFALEDRLWWYRALRELVLWWVEQLDGARQLRILDAGCGTGGMAMLLRRWGNVDGIDASPQAVAYCQQRGLSGVRCVDLGSWEPSPETYDVVISLDVLCHASIRDDAAIVRKFYEALVPGGTLILNLPAFECLRREHDTVVATARRYRKERVCKVLVEAGFVVIHVTYRLPWLFVVALLRKHLERVIPPADGLIRSDLKMLPKWLNVFLLWLARAENKLLRSKISIPVGSSVFAVARKPG